MTHINIKSVLKDIIPREKANEIRPNLPALSGIKSTHECYDRSVIH